MRFDYYYGIEAEQFSFYRVPRLLIKDDRFKGLGSDAKLLYGLMLDRMSLSIKNGWLDEEGRAYIIYTVENIMEDLGCSKPTCTKIMRELDCKNGIGLIERKKRGLGRPDLIYVKNFASSLEEGEEKPEDPVVSPEVKNLNLWKQKSLTSGGKNCEPLEVKETDFRKEKYLMSGSKENEPQEVKNLAANYTDFNQMKNNQNNCNQVSSINRFKKTPDEEGPPLKGYELAEDMSAYMDIIKQNLDYDFHMKYDEYGDRELFEEIYQIICDVVCVSRKSIRIGGEEYPYELVKSRFLKLMSAHVDYVRACMKDTATDITNIKSYLITALYNASITMNYFYQQKVQHDMKNDGW